MHGHIQTLKDGWCMVPAIYVTRDSIQYPVKSKILSWGGTLIHIHTSSKIITI